MNDLNNGFIVSNVIWNFLEKIASQLISLIVSIILARLLLPSDYGLVSMVSIFITFADVLVTSGFATSLIQKKNADQLDFSSVFFLNIGVSIMVYFVLFFSSHAIADYFLMPQLSKIVRILGLEIIIVSISSIQKAYASKNFLFKRLFITSLISAAVSGVVGVAMAYGGFGVWALVAQRLVSAVVVTLVNIAVIKWRPSFLFSFSRLKPLFKYGWKILFEGISETFTNQVRNLIIGKIYTSSDLGYYTKAQLFPSLILTTITGAVSSVILPAMSNVQDKKSEVRHMLRNSVKATSFIVFPAMVGFALIAEPFVKLALTDKWLPCVPYIQIFCLYYGAQVGMACRHEALKSIGRSDVYMIEHIIYRVTVLIILLLIYKISVMAIALSLLAGTVIMSITVGLTSKWYNDYSFKDQFFDVLPIFLACAIMAIPVYLIGRLNLSSIVMLLLQIVVGGVVYIGLSAPLKLEGFQFLIKMVKSRKSK